MVGRQRAAPFCSMHMHYFVQAMQNIGRYKFARISFTRFSSPLLSSPLPISPNSIDDGAAVLNALENYGSPEKTMDDAETKTKGLERRDAGDLM